MKGQKILIVEDEKKISRFLELELKYEGYEVETAYDGREGLEKGISEDIDLIILDLMLPKLSGIEVCRRLRNHTEVPIIMLTAKDDVSDKVLGLDIGADDYMTKPFSMEELIFRIEAILRRMSNDNKQNEQSVFQIGKYTFDSRKQLLIINDNDIKLTTKESELLRLLATNANKVLERNYALKAIWIDDNYFNARSMDVYITKLRKHLKEDPSVEIINVHGKGYKLIL